MRLDSPFGQLGRQASQCERPRGDARPQPGGAVALEHAGFVAADLSRGQCERETSSPPGAEVSLPAFGLYVRMFVATAALLDCKKWARVQLKVWQSSTAQFDDHSAGIPALRRPSRSRSRVSRARGSLLGLLKRALYAFHAAIVLSRALEGSAR
jgi:hypothetical protein